MGIRLNEAQLKQVADVAANFSMIFFGSVILPVFNRLETVDIFVVLSNLGIGFLFLLESLLILSKVEGKL